MACVFLYKNCKSICYEKHICDKHCKYLSKKRGALFLFDFRSPFGWLSTHVLQQIKDKTVLPGINLFLFSGHVNA